MIAVFGCVLLASGMLPPVDFDVCEYHLQAPKEFFQQGRIGFVPHNVYANLPLGSEMLSLAAMTALDEGWLGALVGKTAIAALTLGATLAVWCMVRRYGNPAGALLAAAVYISTPWILHVSTAGLVEGAAAFYLLLACYALALSQDAQRSARRLPPAHLPRGILGRSGGFLQTPGAAIRRQRRWRPSCWSRREAIDGLRPARRASTPQ